jgi:alkanesulfonate monooxygenase SsuD/methylene tetrahydromethanopterin reductase-like flavin-dependent oxidoreductase (luciferase family)
MRFGIFYEHQQPRPWEEGDTERLLSNSLDQVELADRLGFDYVWEVEHHFLEEYSHSSAPEVFLAAASQRTKRIRLGHGIVQLPPGFNHPARVAERAATLDLISGGRVDLGTGEASSQAELGGFGIPRDQKRGQWEESLDAIARMFVEEPFAGIDGRYVQMPPRNVMPKPKQKPHPPLWVACSRRDTILLAAGKGLGALSFSFIEPEDAREWVDQYYAAIETCVPAGFSVNANFAVVLPMMLHEDEAEAIERGIDGAHFFGYSLAHYYVFGEHEPGRTNIWEQFERDRASKGFTREIVTPNSEALGVKLLEQGFGSLRGAIGTPAQVTELVERFERAGVDQIIFALQTGHTRHEHICDSLELFAERVMPPFAERADEVEAEKAKRLAKATRSALKRRDPPRTAPSYVISPQSEPAPAYEAREPAEPGPATSNGSSLGARVNRLAENAFGAFVRGRSDEQLERMFGSSAALRVVFAGMERAFVPGKAGGFDGSIQWELERARGGRATWHMRVTDGRAVAGEGPAEDARVKLRTTIPVFARVMARELDPVRAMMEGKLEVAGDFAVAAQVGPMFGEAERW